MLCEIFTFIMTNIKNHNFVNNTLGKKKVELLKLKEDAISDVMESGMPSELIEKLGSRLKVIGITWNNNIKQIGGNFN